MDKKQNIKVQSAIEQAVGNVQLEEMNLMPDEQTKIESVLQRYRHAKPNEALDSLLHDLVKAVQLDDETKENSYGKGK